MDEEQVKKIFMEGYKTGYDLGLMDGRFAEWKRKYNELYGED